MAQSPLGAASPGVSSVDLGDGYSQVFESDYSYSGALGVPYGYSYIRGDFGQRGGVEGNDFSAGFFLPIFNGDEWIIFADGRANWLQGNIGANGGFGYRRMVSDSRTILGGNVFYDGQQSDLGNWYSQIGAGLELWHPKFDVVGNGYWGMGDNNDIGLFRTNSLSYQGNQVGFNDMLLAESVISGWDLSFGVPIPRASWLRWYNGAYGYNDLGDAGNVTGYRSYLRGWITEDLTTDVSYSKDDYFGSSAAVSVNVMFANSRTGWFRFPSQERRLYNTVDRQYRPVITKIKEGDQFTAAINTDTGNPFNIVHVDNSSASGGNGTVENPYNEFFGSSPSADIFFVRQGTTTVSAPLESRFDLADNQRLLGDGTAHFINTDRGVLQLPSTVNGNAPFLTNSLGNVVNLANNNEVSNFNLISTAPYSAIASTGSNNFLIDRVNMTGNGSGIVINDAQGTGVISNSGFALSGGSSTTGIGILNSNTGPFTLNLGPLNSATGGGVGFDFLADNSVINANLTGILNSGSGIGARFDARNNGDLNAVISGSEFNNTVAGGAANGALSILGATGGAVDLTVTNTDVQNAGEDAVQVSLNNATATVALTNVNMDSAAGRGINVDLTNGATSTVTGSLVTGTNAGGSAVEVNSVASTANFGFTNSNFSNAGTDGFLANLNGSRLNFVSTGTDFNDATLSGVNLTSTGPASTIMFQMTDADLSNAGNNAFSANLTNAVGSIVMNSVDGSSAVNNGIDFSLSGAAATPLSVTINDSFFDDAGADGIAFTTTTGARLNLSGDGNSVTGAGQNGIAISATSGSILNGNLSSTNFSGSALNNVIASYDNATGTLDFLESNFDNAGADAFNLVANNAANFLVNVTDSSIMNAGDDTIDATMANGSTLTVVVDPTNATGAADNGVEFDATGGSTLNLAFIDSPLSNAANPVGNNGIIGTLNGSAANILMDNSDVSNAGADNINIVASNSSNVVLDITDSDVSSAGVNNMTLTAQTGSTFDVNMNNVNASNATQGNVLLNSVGTGSGIALSATGSNFDSAGTNNLAMSASNNGAIVADIDSSSASDATNNNLALTAQSGGMISYTSDNTDYANAGANNIAIDADGVGTSVTTTIDNAVVTGAGNDGLNINARNSAVVTHNSSGVDYNLAANNGITAIGRTSSVINLNLDTANASNNGNDGLFIDLASSAQANLNWTGGGTISNNGDDGVDLNVDGNATQATLVFNDVDILNNGDQPIELNLTNGGDADITFNGGSIDGQGLVFNVNDVNTVLAITLNDTTLQPNPTGAGISYTVLAGQFDLNLIDMDISGNLTQGVVGLVDGAQAVANLTTENSTFSDNGEEGTRLTIVNGGTQTMTDTGSTFNNNGTSGAFSGVVVNNTGSTFNGTFNGTTASSNSESGLVFTGTAGSTQIVTATDLSASNNTQNGVVYNLTGPGSTGSFDLMGTGGAIDTNGGNGVMINIDQITGFDVGLSGNSTNNTGDGYNVVITNSTGINLTGTANATGNNADGFDITIDNSTVDTVNITALTADGNTDNGLLLNVIDSTITTGTIDGAGGSISNNGGNGVALSFNNSTVDFDLANLLIDNNTGVGLLIETPNNLSTTLGIEGNQITNNVAGGFVASASQGTLNVDLGTAGNGNQIGGNTGDQATFNLNGTVAATVNAVDNTIGNAATGAVNPSAADGLVFNINSVTLVGSNIDGNTIDGLGGDGIQFNLDLGGVTNGAQLNNVTINGNTINNAVRGIDFAHGSTNNDFNNIAITNNTINNNTQDGIFANLLNADFTGVLNGNTISNNGGTGVTFDLNGQSNLVLSAVNGNTVSNNGGIGLLVDSFDDSTFDDSTFDVTIGDSSAAQNVFDANTDAGIAFFMAGSLSNMANRTQGNLSVVNTLISNTTDGANTNFDGDGLAVIVNDLARIGASGPIQIGDSTVANTSFTGNAGAGVSFQANGENIAAPGAPMTTRVLGEGQINSVIVDNIVASGNTGNGIEFIRTESARIFGTQILNSEFTENGGGVHLFAGQQNSNLDSDDYLVSGNNISENLTYGLEARVEADADISVIVGDDAGTVGVEAGNTINNNGTNGVQITGRQVGIGDSLTVTMDLAGNDISFNGTNGISQSTIAFMQIGLDDGNAATFSNTITNNGGDGIRNSGLGVFIIADNDISLNDGNGIVSAHTGSGFLGSDVGFIDNNRINENGLDGIAFEGSNTVVYNYDITGNLLQLNGGAGIDLDLIENQGATHVFNIGDGTATGTNMIQANGLDGIEIQVTGVNNGSNDQTGAEGVFNPFNHDDTVLDAQIAIDTNVIDQNSGRGVDILNRGFGFTQVNVDSNEITANGREGLYVVNTASTTQEQSSPTGALADDGSVFADPRLIFNADANLIVNNNNNPGSPFVGGGLVVRVGTSGAINADVSQNPWEDDGRFAGRFENASTDATAAANLLAFNGANGRADSGMSTNRGGVIASITSNEFSGGNTGFDVLFESFVSTGIPATTEGAWSNNNNADPADDQFDITTFEQDPLARFDLNFVGNFGAGSIIDVTRSGASFNNAEGTFKSRTIGGNNPAGDFTSATRARNAQRLASNSNPSFIPPNITDTDTAPNIEIDSSGSFHYPGVGDSTFRVSSSSETTNMGGDAFSDAIGLGGQGSLSFTWGTFEDPFTNNGTP